MTLPQKPTPDQLWALIESWGLDPKNYPNQQSFFEAVMRKVHELRQQQANQDKEP
jgi:hypothetical protein